MFHKRAIAWIVGLSCVAVIAAQPGEDAFRPLAKYHRWLELRGTANARSRLVLRAEVLGKEVLAAFDTGANGTDLNANFADLFPDAVAAGKKGSSDITGVGGTR